MTRLLEVPESGTCRRDGIANDLLRCRKIYVSMFAGGVNQGLGGRASQLAQHFGFLRSVLGKRRFEGIAADGRVGRG